MPAGINVTDWEAFPLADFGRELILNRVTTTYSNISGDAEYSWGANESITAIYAKRGRSPKYSRDIEGIFKSGDAFVQAKTSDNLARMDKITVDGIIYKIDSVKRVPLPFAAGDEALFDFCTLIKISG